MNITVGSPLTLMVNITGFNLPLTTITWMEDGQVLMNNTDNIIITHGSFAAPPTTSTLVRDSIQSPMDNGTYQVVVENPAGQDSTLFTITVNGEQVSFQLCMQHAKEQKSVLGIITVLIFGIIKNVALKVS